MLLKGNKVHPILAEARKSHVVQFALESKRAGAAGCWGRLQSDVWFETPGAWWCPRNFGPLAQGIGVVSIFFNPQLADALLLIMTSSSKVGVPNKGKKSEGLSGF